MAHPFVVVVPPSALLQPVATRPDTRFVPPVSNTSNRIICVPPFVVFPLVLKRMYLAVTWLCVTRLPAATLTLQLAAD